MKVIVALMIALCLFAQEAVVEIKNIPYEQNTNVRFRIFSTHNINFSILLDTSTGEAWQIQKRGGETPAAALKINDKRLVDGNMLPAGRFTIYATQNLWNFFLLDQIDGKLWQLQIGTSDDHRFLEQLR